MKLDNIDRRLLIELEQNGRLTNLALADKVGLSPTPCQKRVKRLEDEGAITGYSAMIDRAVIGLGLTSFAFVTISPHRQKQTKQFATFVESRNEICACHIISGTTDYLLEIVAEDMAAYTRFIKSHLMELPCVASVGSSLSMECLKHGNSIAVLAKRD